MKYPILPLLWESDQVIMDIILKSVSSMAAIQSLNHCHVMLNCIYLSDLVTADGRYLESFVFDPGPVKWQSNYHFPEECPTQSDHDTWFNFWHNFAMTGNKLRVPHGQWTHSKHRKWLWYTTLPNVLHRIEDGFVYNYLPSQSTCRTHLGLSYTLKWKEQLWSTHVLGLPVSVQGSDEQQVYKLTVGPS